MWEAFTEAGDRTLYCMSIYRNLLAPQSQTHLSMALTPCVPGCGYCPKPPEERRGKAGLFAIRRGREKISVGEGVSYVSLQG